jgi:polysaccharide biosynthesis/export protein
MKAIKFMCLGGFVLMFMLSACSVKPRTVNSNDRNKAVVPIKQSSAKSSTAVQKEDQRKKKSPVQAKLSETAQVSVPMAKADAPIPEYILGYGDVVEIKFFYQPEYNETAQVRPDGRITLQKVGDLNVISKTPSELQQLITKVYSDYLVNPEVTVMVREFGGQECYVMGEVEKPGLVNVSKGMTLLRAIAAAGGPKKNAKLNSVILVRSTQNDEKADVTRINLSFSSLDHDGTVDKPIQAFDVIYVPHTFISDLNNFATQLWAVLLPPIDTWVRYRYWHTWHD